MDGIYGCKNECSAVYKDYLAHQNRRIHMFCMGRLQWGELFFPSRCIENSIIWNLEVEEYALLPNAFFTSKRILPFMRIVLPTSVLYAFCMTIIYVRGDLLTRAFMRIMPFVRDGFPTFILHVPRRAMPFVKGGLHTYVQCMSNKQWRLWEATRRYSCRTHPWGCWDSSWMTGFRMNCTYSGGHWSSQATLGQVNALSTLNKINQFRKNV